MRKLLSYFLIFLIISLPLCFATEISYSYDANGNLIQDESSYYEYNGFDQLTRVRLGNSTGTIVSEYFYDHDGNRILTIDYNGSANTSTYYPSDSFVQVVNQSGSYNTTYYYAGNILLAADNGTIAYYHPDHLGSTTLVTDGSGVLLRETKYGPFGAVLSGGNDRYLYTGQEFDSETDLYYYGARFYKPDYYHFTQPDKFIRNLYDPQELNRYAYVENNPYKYVDQSGHFAVPVALVAVALIGGAIDLGFYLLTEPKEQITVQAAATHFIAGAATSVIPFVGAFKKLTLAAKVGLLFAAGATRNLVEKAAEGDTISLKTVAVEGTSDAATFGLTKTLGISGARQSITSAIKNGLSEKTQKEILSETVGITTSNAFSATAQYTITSNSRSSNKETKFTATLAYDTKGQVTGGNIGSFGFSQGFAQKFQSVFGEGIAE